MLQSGAAEQPNRRENKVFNPKGEVLNRKKVEEMMEEHWWKAA
jgi:hypothetical protein